MKSKNKFIKSDVELINYKWKTEKCNVDNCWCCMITTSEKTYYDENDEAYILPTGAIKKEVAKHIVKIHNEWLKKKKEVKK